jgi:TctA family transporter
MEMGAFDAAGHALLMMMDPYRLMLLGLGVVMGLVLGVLPGIGTTAGVAIILPFTFGIDPYAAFAILLGLAAVTATGDPIPAIMFGVPGGAGSAATVLDGQPMAKRGEAGRALSAAYMSSLLGGLVGAVLLFVTVPILRSFILAIGAPQLLAFSAFGISMVAILSGSAPLRGLASACLGIMFSLVGTNPQTGTLRWTFDTIYLWDGLPLVSVVLGIFALPELCDLAIRRTSVAPETRYDVKTGMLEGARDCFRNWWLIIRCSALGAALGTIPGVVGGVIDWLMYGYAMSSEKGARTSFGRGDVRGVIAVESSNNSKEAGQLVPAVAFGVPTTTSMALLIGAFLSHGLTPGPDMLTKHLDITYTMVWSMAIANIVGAGICYFTSGYLAMLSVLRYTLILPGILSIIFVGSFESSRQWGDLYTLLAFGVLGWTMKQLKWARPPLILGLVLGEMIERYLFISVQRYGMDWLFNPVVIVLFAIALVVLVRPLVRLLRFRGGLAAQLAKVGRPTFRPSDLFYLVVIGIIGYMTMEAATWDFRSRIVPVSVGSLGLFFAIVSLVGMIFLRPLVATLAAGGDPATNEQQTIHMDIASDTEHLGTRTILTRAGIFFGWLFGFLASMALIGFIPTVGLFVVGFMRVENREPWKLVLPQAIVLMLFVYFVFDQTLGVPWPPTLLGALFPGLASLPSV